MYEFGVVQRSYEYEQQDEEPLFCNWGHGIGNTSLANPEINSHCHVLDGARPRIVTFLKHISSNDAPSMPCSTGAFVEFKLTTLLMKIPFTFGTALGSHPSSGWSLAPLLNLMGILTLFMVKLLILT